MSNNHKTSKPNIRKRGDTYTWYAYVTDGTGKRRQISKGGYRTVADAEHGRIVHLISIGRHDYVSPNRITLGAFLIDE